MKDTCKNCKWWYKLSDIEGKCRRRAPAADHSWPKTYGGEWCGEFESKVRKPLPPPPNPPTDR